MSDYIESLEAHDRLLDENKRLRSSLANQSVRRFAEGYDQRKIDDLVAAGIRASDAELTAERARVAELTALLHDAKRALDPFDDKLLDARIESALFKNKEPK